MQTHVLAASYPHAQLQPFQPVQASNTLSVHEPSLAAKHHVDPLVAESRSRVSDLPNPKPQL
jgi:hypothetical protein